MQGASTGQSGVGTAEDGNYEVKTEEIAVKGLLTGDGVRFMATSVVSCLQRRYQKDSGIGTVIALMLPYALILTVAWTLFFIAWYALGIPVGPGWPV